MFIIICPQNLDLCLLCAQHPATCPHCLSPFPQTYRMIAACRWRSRFHPDRQNRQSAWEPLAGCACLHVQVKWQLLRSAAPTHCKHPAVVGAPLSGAGWSRAAAAGTWVGLRCPRCILLLAAGLAHLTSRRKQTEAQVCFQEIDWRVAWEQIRRE